MTNVITFDATNEPQVVGGPAGWTRLFLGEALCDLAGRDECVGDMRDEFLAADCEPEHRSNIGAANDIDFWRFEAEMPT